ncbi:hypothetical protein DFH27DRAFT_218541 [Peziza echinospora]|nr:hypothetical protein DFH27DRAFT_218541 [Peziza echinospora]
MHPRCSETAVAGIEAEWSVFATINQTRSHMQPPPMPASPVSDQTHVLSPLQPNALGCARRQAARISSTSTQPRGLELTDALTPTALERLAAAANDTDGGHFVIHGVSREAVSAWRRRFSKELGEDGRRAYEYNAITRDFAVKCMPSPYHGQVESFFTLSTAAALAALPRGKGLQSVSALRCGGCVTLQGFGGGDDGPAHGSQKIPDFSIQAMLDGVDFPAVAVECGFTQTLRSLIDAANLHLTGTDAQTRLVILVDLQETLAKKKVTYPWPKGHVAEPVLAGLDETQQTDEVRKKEVELTKLYKLHELKRNGTTSNDKITQRTFPPLLGTVTGTAHIYMRTDDTKLLEHLFLDSRPTPAPDPRYPKIALIDTHTFMRGDVPVPEGDDGKGFRGLRFPLRILYPPNIHPPEAVAGYLDELLIQFSWHELAEMVLVAKRGMIHSRAVTRADAVMNKWLEGKKKNTGNLQMQVENDAGGTSRPKRKRQTRAEKTQEILVRKVYWTQYAKQKASEGASEELSNDENEELLAEESEYEQEGDDTYRN